MHVNPKPPLYRYILYIQSGGIKNGLRGKKYRKNNALDDKKKDKKKKRTRGKKSDKMTEQEQCFIKLLETWKKNAGNRGHNIIFFPLLF